MKLVDISLKSANADGYHVALTFLAQAEEKGETTYIEGEVLMTPDDAASMAAGIASAVADAAARLLNDLESGRQELRDKEDECDRLNDDPRDAKGEAADLCNRLEG
jgi:hypothetical protein|nr:MAG TPA: hypothetical protein [Caudoviricetes sp.]